MAMGFALWITGDLAWAEGTHEYRPMGAAVVGARGVFTPRDFSAARRAPVRGALGFAGLYASLGEVNRRLAQRRSQGIRRAANSRNLRTFSLI
jgi:hypothetical protein